MGCGGFGFVVAAKDKNAKRQVALKIVEKNESTADHCRMLRREAEILQDLDHDNIIKIYRLDIY